MTNTTRRAVWFGLVMVLLTAAPAGARRGDRLHTHRGVLMLGGRVAFDIDHINPDGGDSVTGVLLDFSPTFGGFVINNLLLHGGVSVQSGFGDLYDNTPTNLGLRFGLQYLFNYRSIVVPYLGLTLGPTFSFPDQGDTATAFLIAFPAGILIALNNHVAVIIGTELEISVGMTDPKATIIHLPLGYLGVSAFF